MLSAGVCKECWLVVRQKMQANQACKSMFFYERRGNCFAENYGNVNNENEVDV